MDGLLELPRNKLADVRVFNANAPVQWTGWTQWNKRPGTTMVSILCIGGGGRGGNGVVGAVSTAAGGGGGGSGAQSYVVLPSYLLPDKLFVTVGYGSNTVGTAGVVSAVTLSPFTSTITNDVIVYANGGNTGGNASGATAGTAGTGGGAATLATCPIAGWGNFQFIAGQNGIVGATTGTATNLTLPLTGLRVTGGTGGGGLGNASSVGSGGGAFTVAGVFPAHQGGAPGGNTAYVGSRGSAGYAVLGQYGYFYGGTGGSSTGGAASGGIGCHGGDGGIGSGGGGGGGAFTGSVQGLGGKGGDGLVIITSW